MSNDKLPWIPLDKAYPSLHQVDPHDPCDELGRYLISDPVLGLDKKGRIDVVTYEPTPEPFGFGFGYWLSNSCDYMDVVAWMPLPKVKQFNVQSAKEYDIQSRDKAHRIMEVLWEAFEDVPMNPETERIEERFFSWEAGTERSVIWSYFNNIYPGGIEALNQKVEERKELFG